MLRDTHSTVEQSADWPLAKYQIPDWQVVDRELRKIAKRRAALDAEEARWLREAERCQIWRELGMVSALDYLERVLGYAPRTAQERLRVARSLGELPVLTDALASGELAFSAIRELTRVAVASTEAAWCEAAKGKNLRQIEELVSDHKPGDRPEDPKDPEARVHVVRVEISAETFALWRQVRQVLDEERGASLSDDALVATMCGAVLRADGAAASGRAKWQIAMVVCEACRKGWQEGAGVKVAVENAVVDRAMCDAQYVERIDDRAASDRAHQEVAPSVARRVWRRDGWRCRVPGCRSSRGLEIHHVVHRAHGGSHEAANLVLLCSACHAAHHRGKVRITGTAEALNVERAHVGATATAVTRTQAKDALTGLGWKPAVAVRAVDAAIEALGRDAALERVIFEALRRCAN
ncbi:MAG TPA: HNH endonuclease signature motif containing protein [Kofleriaceae bacterium]|nr:HNH endonuclease signature motif containing protein [Kofleriaceae bacterium]